MTHEKRPTILWFLLTLFALFISSCAMEVDSSELNTILEPVVETQIASSITDTPTPLPPSPTPTASITPTPAPTLTPSPTNTPLPTSTPTWIFNEAGQVIAPILLYHHVETNEDNRYYVSPENFRAQMQALKDWGYTPIPISILIEALIRGAELPPKPVVITFDDGHISVYENAFPLMDELGFPGVFYILPTRLEADDFVNVDQLTEMITAGWEIGSHGKSHIDLTANHDTAQEEIRQSKLDLEKELGIEDILTFAYPFGTVDKYTADKVYSYGYDAAVGLGKSWTHTWANLYYLNRIEIYGDYTLEDIAERLPWAGGE